MPKQRLSRKRYFVPSAFLTKDPRVNAPVPYESQALQNLPEVPARKQFLVRQISPESAMIAALRLSRAMLPPEHAIAERLRKAMGTLRQEVEVRSSKCGGAPVLTGTRFKVSQLLAQLADGDSIKEIADNFELDDESLARFLHSMAIVLDRPMYK